jgi:hypothetical protein
VFPFTRPSPRPVMLASATVMLFVSYSNWWCGMRSLRALVGVEGFAVDASLIAADANKQRSVASTDKVNWPELVRTRRSVGISRYARRGALGCGQ